MEPYPNDLVYASDFAQLVGDICLRPGMMVSPVTFDTVCAYFEGFNAARSGGPLMGLEQWLIVRANEGNNRVWSALAREQLSIDPADAGLPDEEQAIRALGRLLAEFFEYRRSNGITKVFHEYAKWLLRRSWYTGPLRRQQGQEAEPDAHQPH